MDMKLLRRDGVFSNVEELGETRNGVTEIFRQARCVSTDGTGAGSLPAGKRSGHPVSVRYRLVGNRRRPAARQRRSNTATSRYGSAPVRQPAVPAGCA